MQCIFAKINIQTRHILNNHCLVAHSYLWAFLAHLSERLKRVFLIKVCQLSVVVVVIVVNFSHLGNVSCKIYLGLRSPGPRWFKFVQIEGSVLFKGKVVRKQWTFIDFFLKYASFLRTGKLKYIRKLNRVGSGLFKKWSLGVGCGHKMAG